MNRAVVRRNPGRRMCLVVVCASVLPLAGGVAAQTPGAEKDAGAVAPSAAKENGMPTQSGNANAPLPVFDAVSIKPYESGDMMMRIQATADGISTTGLLMHMILREALGVTDAQLLHEPDWVNSKRYNIEAKVAPEDAPRLKGLTPQQRWRMMLPVLEDRCALKFHHETKDLAVYDLVIAKGGLKMKPADPNESAPGPPSGPPGPPPAPPGGSGASGPPPGPGQTRMTANPGGGMFMIGRASPMATIVRMISMTLGSTVVDKTGLAGKYDYTLQFASDENMRAGMPGPPGAAPPPDAEGPSLFAAIQEQLGLKLEAHKEPVDVIVIDHLEEPTAN